MSLDLIAKSDFIGFLTIDFSELADDFTDYANQLEKRILTDLFGKAMYEDMLLNPTEPVYVTLIDDYLKDMQQGFFYYYYLKDRESYSSTLGEFEAMAENAERNRASRNSKITKAYNDGVRHYMDAYEYVNDNQADYPLYDKTVPKGYQNVWGIIQAPTRTGDYPIDHDDWFIRGAR